MRNDHIFYPKWLGQCIFPLTMNESLFLQDLRQHWLIYFFGMCQSMVWNANLLLLGFVCPWQIKNWSFFFICHLAIPISSSFHFFSKFLDWVRFFLAKLYQCLCILYINPLSDEYWANSFPILWEAFYPCHDWFINWQYLYYWFIWSPESSKFNIIPFVYLSVCLIDPWHFVFNFNVIVLAYNFLYEPYNVRADITDFNPLYSHNFVHFKYMSSLFFMKLTIFTNLTCWRVLPCFILYFLPFIEDYLIFKYQSQNTQIYPLIWRGFLFHYHANLIIFL